MKLSSYSTEPQSQHIQSWRTIGAKIRVNQKPYEISRLRQLLINANKRGVGMEIGVEMGATMRYLAPLFNTYIGLDIKKTFDPSKDDWLKEHKDIRYIESDSSAFKTLRIAYHILKEKGQLLDFLFIDGNHEYQAAKKDFEWYSKLVKPGGFVAFHDIQDHPLNDAHGNQVYWLWEDIKWSGYDHIEIKDDKESRSEWIGAMGIGVIQMEDHHMRYDV